MNSLKIGVVIDQLLPGGVQIAAIEEVKELNKLGHQAKLLILMRKKYTFQFQGLLKNVPHCYLSDSFPWPFISTLKFPIFAFFSTLHLLSYFFVKKMFSNKNFDLLVCHSSGTSFAVFGFNLPYIAFIHDPLPYILKKVYSKTLLKYLFPILLPLSLLLEKKFVQRAKKVILGSHVHLSFVQRKYQVKPVTISYGSRVLARIPKRRGSAILACSRWQKEKNPLFLLQLLTSLPQTKLIIAGVWTNNKDYLDFQKRVEKMKLSSRVAIIPQFADRQFAKLCRQSRLLVHPHFEAFGLAGLQAAAHGLPIIMPARSGVTTLFESQKDGYFPQKINLKSYLKPIKKLLNSERLAFKLGQHAWKKVKANYSWKAHSQKLAILSQKAYKQLLTPKITVLEISHASGTGLSGGDKIFEEMAKRFREKVSLNVITSPYGALHWKKSNLPIQLTILKSNPWEKGVGPMAVFLTYCCRIIQASFLLIQRRQSIQFLYSSTNILPDVLPGLVVKISRPKIIWLGRIHHLIPPPFKREGLLIVNCVSWLMQKISLFCFKAKANLTFCLNRSLFTTLKKYGFSQKRLMVLGAGIDFLSITHYQPKKNPGFEAVYLGRLHPTKGIFDCLSIWKKVIKKIPQVKLAIIGAGPAFITHEIMVKIKKFKLTKNIKILGYLPENQIYDYLKTAKVFLFTDHEAGWAMAVAEAMACKLPVIGYDIGVLGTVYHKGYLLAPLNDKEIFSTQIIKLLQDKKLRSKISIEAYQEAQKFSWEKTTAKFLNLLLPFQKG